MGHAGRTVADGYGDVTLKAKAVAIRKLLSFDLDKLRVIAGGRGGVQSIEPSSSPDAPRS